MNAITKCTILENVYSSLLGLTTENLFQIFTEKKLNPLIEVRHGEFFIHELVSDKNSYEIIPISVKGCYNLETDSFVITSKVAERYVKQISFDNSFKLSTFLTTSSFFEFIIESANLAADVLFLQKNF